ncbi:MAG: DNA repair exonuclease [Planctomycetales bacterium]|nr:DNA repair exonuclease [Planctomycetales bacterium]
MRFLHAADLHIDSPLRGLDSGAGAPAERLRSATRHAAERMVELAEQHEVDFVVLAGDIFDGPWQDMRTGIWTSQLLAKLAHRHVPVFMLRGNHDAQSKVRQAVSWPANVQEFPVDRPATFTLPKQNVALHGQGFAEPKVMADLAANYPAARPGMLNIGVLHTSLTGNPEHDTYAPTTEATLASKGYDYWALGHIHLREVVREANPCIVFSGNTQGRHIRETGAKGCYLVDLQPHEPPQLTFCETDCLRWQRIELQLQEQQSLADVFDAAEAEFRRVVEREDGRFVVARVVLRGACRAHRELLSSAALHEASAELRARSTHVRDLWLEKIQWETRPLVDVERLRQGQDLLGELLRDLQTASEDPDRLAALAVALEPLEHKAPTQLKDAEIQLNNPEQLAKWLKQAEGMLVSLLQGGGGEP